MNPQDKFCPKIEYPKTGKVANAGIGLQPMTEAMMVLHPV